MLAQLCSAPLQNWGRRRKTTAAAAAAATAAATVADNHTNKQQSSRARRRHSQPPLDDDDDDDEGIDAQQFVPENTLPATTKVLLWRAKSFDELSSTYSNCDHPLAEEAAAAATACDDIDLSRTSSYPSVQLPLATRNTCPSTASTLAVGDRPPDGSTVAQCSEFNPVKVKSSSGVLFRMKNFTLKHTRDLPGRSSASASSTAATRTERVTRVVGTRRQQNDESQTAQRQGSGANGELVQSHGSANTATASLNSRPDLINSVLERTSKRVVVNPPPPNAAAAKHQANVSNEQMYQPHLYKSDVQTAKTKTITAGNATTKQQNPAKSSSRDKSRPKAKKGFGYDINDVTGFLDRASRHQPANIPMVLTQNVVLRSVISSAKRTFLPVSMGNVINALYKTNSWVFVQTAHGDEGFLPYKACIPLGIMPLTATDAAPWELSNGLPVNQKTVPCLPEVCSDIDEQSTNGGDATAPQDTPKNSSNALYANLEFLANVPKPESCESDGSPSETQSKLNLPQLRNKTDTQKLMEFSSTALTEKPPFVPAAENKETAACNVEVMVVCDYMPKAPNHVTVKSGEMVTLIRSASVDWLLVKTKSKLEGLIPTAYTTLGKQCFL